jgi:hypothetical protein
MPQHCNPSEALNWFIFRKALNKPIMRAIIPSEAKTLNVFAALSARLKSCPFKTITSSQHNHCVSDSSIQ